MRQGRRGAGVLTDSLPADRSGHDGPEQSKEGSLGPWERASVRSEGAEEEEGRALGVLRLKPAAKGFPGHLLRALRHRDEVASQHS